MLKGSYNSSSELPPSQVDISKCYWISASNRNHGFAQYNREGKWLIFVTRDKVDEMWEKVKQGIKEQALWHAKVSAKNPDKRDHVIIVYTYDYQDRADIIATLDYLQKNVIAATSTIYYKTDAQTSANLYASKGDKAWLYNSSTIRQLTDNQITTIHNEMHAAVKAGFAANREELVRVNHFIQAVKSADIATIEQVLKNKVYDFKRDEHHILNLAVIFNHLDVVKLLVKTAPNLICKSPTSGIIGNLMGTKDEKFVIDCSPFEVAILKGFIEIVKYFLTHHIDVSAVMKGYQKARGGYSLLGSVIAQNSIDMAELLLNNGADVNAGVINPLHYAAKNCSIKALGLLIQCGANVKNFSTRGTALHFLAEVNATRVNEIKQLLNLNTEEDVYAEQLKCARLLLSHGANISVKNSSEKTAYDLAAANNNEPLMNLLDGTKSQLINTTSMSQNNLVTSNQEIETLSTKRPIEYIDLTEDDDDSIEDTINYESKLPRLSM